MPFLPLMWTLCLPCRLVCRLVWRVPGAQFHSLFLMYLVFWKHLTLKWTWTWIKSYCLCIHAWINSHLILEKKQNKNILFLKSSIVGYEPCPFCWRSRTFTPSQLLHIFSTSSCMIQISWRFLKKKKVLLLRIVKILFVLISSDIVRSTAYLFI